jgi:signal transduction histidine kinase
VRLTDLPRTTSFRLSVLFLALFGVSSAVFFFFLYWQATTYLNSSVDHWIARDSATYLTAPGEIVPRLQTHAERDLGAWRPFGLFNSSGHYIAGNLRALPKRPVAFGRYFEYKLERNGKESPFRGVGYRMANGDILILSYNVNEIYGFKHLLLDAMAWGGVMVFGLGIAGALITGLGAVRQINGITGAVERIVTGNLAERLPTRRGAGDLDRLVYLVNGMLDDIERLMREVKGVTDDIAHDLRTPLTRLLGGLERARRRGSSSDEYARAVDEAIAETKAVLGTFSALLRIAEVEDGARRAGFARMDLGQIAADVVEFQAPVAEERGVQLSFDTDAPSLTQMSGDPSLMFEAISNLVDNAIKFSPTGGCVAVRTFYYKGRIGVAVSDNGPGIPAHEREAVLRRFHRLEKSRHTPGSGLGLSLVAAVAKLHGLSLTIDSSYPGSCVTLERDQPSQMGMSAPLAPPAQVVAPYVAPAPAVAASVAPANEPAVTASSAAPAAVGERTGSEVPVV